jgi:hypothetical protein
MPAWLRVCLNSCLILGIFAMHHVLVAEHPAHHVDSASMSMAVQVDVPHGVAAFIEGDGHPAGTMSDCCGLMMLCLAMIVGASAFLVLRRRMRDRVLWQLPPPLRLGDALRLPPLHGLTPLQRSSILRC